MSIDPFLYLRALACLAIIWTHVQPSFDSGTWLVIHGVDFSSLAYPNPFAAVFIFFLLSGYDIGYGFATGRYVMPFPSLLLFYFNRIIRIVPLYYFCIFVSVMYFYRDIPIPHDVLFRLLTFTANDSTRLPVLFPYAIVSTEMQFYILAPLLFVMVNAVVKKVPIVITGIAVLLLGIGIRYGLLSLGLVESAPEWTKNVYTTLYGNIDIFLAGMLISLGVSIYRQTKVIHIKTPVAIGGLASVVLFWYVWSGNLYYTYPFYPMSSYLRNMMLFVLPLSTIVIIGICLFFAGITRRWSPVVHYPPEIVKRLFFPKQTLNSLGILSYGIYLWHWPIMDRLFYRNDIQPGIVFTIYRFGIVFGLTLCLSIFSYAFIEYPFSGLKQWVHSLPDRVQKRTG